MNKHASKFWQSSREDLKQLAKDYTRNIQRDIKLIENLSSERFRAAYTKEYAYTGQNIA